MINFESILFIYPIRVPWAPEPPPPLPLENKGLANDII